MRKSKLLPNVPIWRQHDMIDKRDWKEVGSQIIITLGGPTKDNNECNSWDHNNTNNIIPNTIHTIVDRPTRKSRRNGEFGVWVNGINGKVFVWFHEWYPYVPPAVMMRTKYAVLVRTKPPKGLILTRTR